MGNVSGDGGWGLRKGVKSGSHGMVVHLCHFATSSRLVLQRILTK